MLLAAEVAYDAFTYKIGQKTFLKKSKYKSDNINLSYVVYLHSFNFK